MRSILAMAVTVATFFLSGCALPYYWQAASGQLDLLSRRVPISEVIDDPGQSPETRAALERALRMREYAVSSLGLPDNDSYTSYADLGRRFAVWSVVAAPEFSVDPVNWCFPIAGCVSYRGYFSEDDAQRYADRLRDDGYETYIGGVTAYSTLGYFSDPLLNTMLLGGDSYVAGIIFHELAHQRSYIRGETAINEAFATAVSEFGTARWLEMTADAETVAEHRARAERREVFFDLIARYQDRLRSIYESPAVDEEKRSLKSAAFDDLIAEHETLKAAWGGVSDYDNWFSGTLNNAQLASVVAYSRWLPNIRAYLDAHGLMALYAEMAVLEELSPAEREDRLRGYL